MIAYAAHAYYAHCKTLLIINSLRVSAFDNIQLNSTDKGKA